MIKVLFCFIIKAYQYIISPVLGNNCRFFPTCSEYALLAIKMHGLVKGSGLAFRRLLSCHPLYKGGFDPVPEPVKKKDYE